MVGLNLSPEQQDHIRKNREMALKVQAVRKRNMEEGEQHERNKGNGIAIEEAKVDGIFRGMRSGDTTGHW
jgi:hypothetical protein